MVEVSDYKRKVWSITYTEYLALRIKNLEPYCKASIKRGVLLNTECFVLILR